jgi:hypothetical protein
MRVLCNKTTSEGFDLKEVNTVKSNDFDYTFGGKGIELNKEYIVMGLAIFQSSKCVYYLIDVYSKPVWFPSLLFNTIDNKIPDHWFLNIYKKNENPNIYLLLGFDELCNNENFYDLLIEREEVAMRIYFKRKIELEREMMDNKLLT